MFPTLVYLYLSVYSQTCISMVSTKHRFHCINKTKTMAANVLIWLQLMPCILKKNM